MMGKRDEELARALERAGGSGGRCPGPLEIEAAQVAGDVDDFAYEKESGDETRFHGFTGEFASVNAAGGNFGLFVAFAGRRSEGPIV